MHGSLHSAMTLLHKQTSHDESATLSTWFRTSRQPRTSYVRSSLGVAHAHLLPMHQPNSTSRTSSTSCLGAAQQHCLMQMLRPALLSRPVSDVAYSEHPCGQQSEASLRKVRTNAPWVPTTPQ